MMRYSKYFFVALAACALAAASSVQGAAVLERFVDRTTVPVIIHVGSPAAGSAVPTVSGGVQVSASVTGATTARWLTVDSRSLQISANPGQTITLSCPVHISVTAPYEYSLRTELTNAFSSSFPAGDMSYKVYAVGATPPASYSAFLAAPQAPVIVAHSYTGASATYCADYQLTVPSNAAPGDYYDTIAYVVYTSQMTAYPPTPGPTPTPTPTPLPYDQVIKGDGPGVYYRLDEPAANYPANVIFADSSGNGDNGQYMQGNPGILGTVGWTSVSGALNVSSDPAISLPAPYGFFSAYNPTASSYTVEAWVKATVPNFEIAMSSAYNCSGFSVIVGGEIGDNTTQISPGQIGAGFGEIAAGTDVTGVEALGVVSSTTINDGAWHLVTAVWSGTAGTPIAADQIRIYVDGTDVTGGAFQSGTPATPPAPLAINDSSCPNGSVAAPGGVSASAEGSNFSIDEYVIYPYALTLAQIQNHYHAAGY